MTKTLFVVLAITSMFLVGCGGKETVTDTSTETGTETIVAEVETSTPSTEEPITTPEPTETPVEEFEIYIIDYLTDSEVIETVYSVDEEGRPLATVTHADGTIQWHTLYVENGEILWFAEVKGENEGGWGGDYKIPSSVETEATETPAPTEEPTPEQTETPVSEHEHSYTKTILQEATSCSIAGTKLFACSCGHSYEKQYYGDCIGDGNPVVIFSPTCTDQGLSSEHCIVCGRQMNYQLNMPATGHTPKDHWEYFTHTGNYYLACSICNRVITSTTTRPEGVEINEITPIDSNTLQPIP